MSPRHLSLVVRALAALMLTGLVFVVGQARADGPAPARKTSGFEIKFMKGMIDHHMMAVMMAELCDERAVHEELKTLCHDIIEAQTTEIEDMQSWLHDWYSVSYEPRMRGKDRKQLRELARLDGDEFEIEFMMMMIEHHMMAIEEGEDCLEHADHDELLELCENIVETQSDEIELMQHWLCEWYHICDH